MPPTTNIETEITKEGFFKYSSIGDFLINFFQVILVLGSIASFVFFLWGGLEFILSSGNQDKNKAAKTKITSAVAGLGIMATAWVIWRLITYFFGISTSPSGPFNINIPKP